MQVAAQDHAEPRSLRGSRMAAMVTLHCRVLCAEKCPEWAASDGTRWVQHIKISVTPHGRVEPTLTEARYARTAAFSKAQHLLVLKIDPRQMAIQPVNNEADAFWAAQ